MNTKSNKTNIKRKTNKSKKRKFGGSVLASGGFGCVFSPALLCKGEQQRKPKNVSKLMTTRYANEEYNFINKIREKLKTIPNYKDYFMIEDIEICAPDKLSYEDLSNFKKKCNALPKDGINEKNINDNLDNITILNMPNGGEEVDNYIFNTNAHDKLFNLNQKLIDLFTNGIIPMNNKNIYHSDIKNSNILIDSSLKTRLIDWGLYTEYSPKDKILPKMWVNRPLQFNVPFSVILFTDLFNKRYTTYIKNGGKIDKINLKPFVVSYLKSWIKIRPGHYRVINDIMFMLFSNDLKMNSKLKWKAVEQRYTIPYIVNYIVDILVNYTHLKSDGSFDAKPYLDNVYIHIVDVWGFLSNYFAILELLYNNYNDLNKDEILLFDQIKQLILDYLYNPRSKPIDTKELIHDLDKLFDYQIFNKTMNSSSKISFIRTNKKTRRAQTLVLVPSKKK
jgi:serine/threonine protein kinase